MWIMSNWEPYFLKYSCIYYSIQLRSLMRNESFNFALLFLTSLSLLHTVCVIIYYVHLTRKIYDIFMGQISQAFTLRIVHTSICYAA